MNKSIKTVYTCQTCGYETPKWMGKCPDCSEWHTFVEETKTSKRTPGVAGKGVVASAEVIAVSAIDSRDESRILTGINELDRALGGGLVPGTLILIGGDPGIGKSTLMLQAMHGLSQDGQKVLYVSGEESVRQLGLRSKRLSTLSADILAVSEIEIDAILAIVEKTRPGVIVIDSIQTMYSADLTSAPGSVSQVRESAMRLMLMAKHKGIPTFLVGHVTKEGAIAGPRLLEHMVDTVLYFEGDRNHVFRILRAVKNRFGSTNEIGVFEMKENGLNEVDNPSAIFLSERPEASPGSVVTSSMEGTRPILVELQALASSTNLGTPRRTILGLDQNRVALLVAVMEKKLGMHLLGHDIFMNVAGGVRIDEPGVDLGIVSAIASSFLDQPVMEGTAVVGEVGLTGEVRAVGQIETRAGEMKKMGFTRCLVPRNNLERMATVKGLDLIGVKNISEAMEVLF
ncbi:MAG: DNA repair protein RadA [Desulfobacterales bacterium]|nr:DNA repair protein RadA [Desulfobacterales bacterium]MDX2513300.1 DNA repair protein RadA [Desulfobacterales bacterium]